MIRTNSEEQNFDLDYLTVLTGKEPPQHSVIWLHGLGADGYDFESIVPELGLNALPIRFIFPHAPYRNVTINAGMSMRAWYDITGPRLEDRQDNVGISLSAKQVDALIQAEIKKGIPVSNIILAGFSQGGAIALYTALTYQYPLCGIMALSTYLPLASKVKEAIDTHTALKAQASLVPILMVHGKQDTVVPVEVGYHSMETLVSLGCQVQWQTYPMAHSLCPQEIVLISRWLRQRITGVEAHEGTHHR